MATYNVQINKYNATNASYDQLYPKTTAEMVDGLETELSQKATTATYTVSVTTTWTEDTTNGGFTQTVAVDGILSTDNPIADVLLGADVAANAVYLEAWSAITRITTSNDSITLYANGEAPVSAFTCHLKVVR